MNPYIKNKQRLSEIERKKDKIEKEIKNKIEEIKKSFKFRLDSLSKERDEIIESCNHTNEKGENAWIYTGQDPGSGKSEHKCTICNDYD
jgi:gamma-glutamylcyclotransferase (GGCT)/AIG2-like uncharacterized protein YtfP